MPSDDMLRRELRASLAARGGAHQIDLSAIRHEAIRRRRGRRMICATVMSAVVAIGAVGAASLDTDDGSSVASTAAQRPSDADPTLSPDARLSDTPLQPTAPIIVFDDGDAVVTARIADDQLALDATVEPSPGAASVAGHQADLPPIVYGRAAAPTAEEPTAVYVFGATRVEARWVRVLTSAETHTTEAIEHPAFPTLRFFVLRLPTSDPRGLVTVAAYDGSDRLLVDSDRIKDHDA